MEKIWIDNFFDDGTLRLGTLWDYRNSNHASGIHDPFEGLSYLNCDNGEIVIGVMLNAKDSYIFCTSQNPEISKFSDPLYNSTYIIESIDFFVEIAHAIEDELSSTFLANVIYDDEETLRNEVTRQLRLKVPYDIASPPAAYLKNPTLKQQQEVRAYFQLKNDPNEGRYPNFLDKDNSSHRDMMTPQMKLKSLLSPKIIKVPEAIKHASRI